MEADKRQVGGSHYKGHYQHWDFVRDLDLPYLLSQATRYLARHKKKNGLEDVEKLEHYLEKANQEQEKMLSTIDEFVLSAGLDTTEAECLKHICFHRLASALNHARLIKLEYGSATEGYVNQDR